MDRLEICLSMLPVVLLDLMVNEGDNDDEEDDEMAEDIVHSLENFS